jgi:mRNA interferase MazF
MVYPKRGDIYWVQLDPVIGSEISKTRPALVISNDIGNEYSDRVIVAPITSKGLSKIYPFEVAIPKGGAGLEEGSKILLDQIRTVDKMRLAKRVGRVSPEIMLEVDRAIHLSLGLGN